MPNSILTRMSQRKDLRNLTLISNNAGLEDYGIGLLLNHHQVKRMISSYVGENKEFERQYFAGELELELMPQGTLAEKIRAGGNGIAHFSTRTGVGTIIESGGFIIKYDSDGRASQLSQRKETIEHANHKYLLEQSLVSDISLIKAYKADRHGNLQYRKSARNFNPDMARNGKRVFAEVEQIVDGALDPENVHTPGVFVDAVVLTEETKKPIEKVTNTTNMDMK